MSRDAETWHYTHEGERIGPVGLSELRIKAKEGALHPRLDMVWTQGMEEWKPAGEIDGLFERAVPAEQPPALSPGPAVPNPYSSSMHEDDETMTQTAGWPGARRRSFYLIVFIFPIVWSFAFEYASGFLSTMFPAKTVEMIGLGVMAVPVILSIFFALQRLANVGMSRWWFLGNLIPILNIWVNYRMYVCPAGYAHHKKLDTAGVILAILFWLMLLLSLLALAAIIAVFFGFAGNPEIQQKFNEAIQEALKQQPAGS